MSKCEMYERNSTVITEVTDQLYLIFTQNVYISIHLPNIPRITLQSFPPFPFPFSFLFFFFLFLFSRNEAVVASTSLRLRELQDQENHDIALHLKMRYVNE